MCNSSNFTVLQISLLYVSVYVGLSPPLPIVVAPKVLRMLMKELPFFFVPWLEKESIHLMLLSRMLNEISLYAVFHLLNIL